MKIVFLANYSKHYKKRILPNKFLDKQFEKRLRLFLENPSHPLLKDHSLHGDLRGYRSFSITGDIRVIYYIKNETIHFSDIGAQTQVY